MTTLTLPEVTTDLDGVPDDVFDDEEPDATHIVSPRDLIHSQITGEAITALCGKRWTPRRDPDNYPICQGCLAVAHARMAS